MKPNDLKPPYVWEERKPCLYDGILFLPPLFSCYEKFSFPLWDGVFSQEGKVCLEYCSGNGKWIVDRALQNKDVNHVAVDIRFDRVRKIWAKMRNENLHNLFCVYGDGFTFAKHYVPSHSVQEIYINFPDPWPKLRHAKHRLITPPFLVEQHRILQRGGSLTFVTDDACYLQWTLERFKQVDCFDFCFPEPHFVCEMPLYGSSYFEELWVSRGKKIHYLKVLAR